MMQSSFYMDKIAEALIDIKNKYGYKILSDAQNVYGLLAAALPEDKNRILIKKAIEAGIAGKIEEKLDAGIVDIYTVEFLKSWLQKQSGMTAEQCEAAVLCFLKVYGHPYGASQEEGGAREYPGVPDAEKKEKEAPAAPHRRRNFIITAAAFLILAAAASCCICIWLHVSDTKNAENIKVAENTGDEGAKDKSEAAEPVSEKGENIKVTEAASEEAEEFQSVTEAPAEIKEKDALISERMWEKDGTIYTVYSIQKDGYKVISGDYLDTMILDGDRIYLRKTSVEGEGPRQIISMNLDGTDQIVLTEDAHPSSYLCVYNGYLYYTSLDEQGNKGSRKINLETGAEEQAPPYMFRMGNNKVWFSTDLSDGQLYSSDPGYENAEPVNGVKGTYLGVVDTKLYYMDQVNGRYKTYSYDSSKKKREIILDSWPSKSIVKNGALFYKDTSDGSTILYRMDLSDESVRSYNLGDLHLYMGGGFYELGGKMYFTRFRPEKGISNTEFWSMSCQTGEGELIGRWYNSNAENASKEP